MSGVTINVERLIELNTRLAEAIQGNVNSIQRFSAPEAFEQLGLDPHAFTDLNDYLDLVQDLITNTGTLANSLTEQERRTAVLGLVGQQVGEDLFLIGAENLELAREQLRLTGAHARGLAAQRQQTKLLQEAFAGFLGEVAATFQPAWETATELIGNLLGYIQDLIRRSPQLVSALAGAAVGFGALSTAAAITFGIIAGIRSLFPDGIGQVVRAIGIAVLIGGAGAIAGGVTGAVLGRNLGSLRDELEEQSNNLEKQTAEATEGLPKILTRNVHGAVWRTYCVQN